MPKQDFLTTLQLWAEPLAAIFFLILIALAIGTLLLIIFHINQRKKNRFLIEEHKSLEIALKDRELLNAQLEGQLQPFETLQTNFLELNERKNILQEQLAKLEATSHLQQQHLQDKIEQLEQHKKEFKAEFEALSQQVLGSQRKEINDQTDKQINAWLRPLKEQMLQFQNKVDDVYLKDNEGRQKLLSEIGHLKSLNQQINQEAMNLTQALKSESKARGMWGELILEQVLQASGLRKGEEYETQVSFTDEDKQRLIPDALVYLPDNKQLVVDAKVTLNHFEQWVNAETEQAKLMAEKQFIQTANTRVKELSDKNYPGAIGHQALNMVIMFIPIESAFQMLLQNHANIFADALMKNVIIASPSTLLANLRVIEKLWHTQKQSENAYKIAEQAGKLYDKLALYLQTFEDIGDKLFKAQNAFDKAKGQLSTGKGNALKLANDLQKMGINSKKQLPVFKDEDGEQ